MATAPGAVPQNGVIIAPAVAPVAAHPGQVAPVGVQPGQQHQQTIIIQNDPYNHPVQPIQQKYGKFPQVIYSKELLSVL